MPRAAKGPRLWKRIQPGKQPVWIIKDGDKQKSTGIFGSVHAEPAPPEALKALADYIAASYSPPSVMREASQVPIPDVLGHYLKAKLGTFENEVYERRFVARIGRLNGFFANRVLTDLNSNICDAYVQNRGSSGGARRDLEDLRAAIGLHAKDNLHHAVIHVALPRKGKRRERWLTRSEAARLLWAAWTYREVQTVHVGKNKGKPVVTDKRPLRHIARFILIGLYTGTRASAIAAASPYEVQGRAHVDLDRGIFYRLAVGKRATNKRQPPVPLPDRLLAHMRRWKDRGIIANHFVEWQGQGVKSVKNGFATAVEFAQLSVAKGNVTPHTLRHTAATWLMQTGTDIWQASGFLGMSVKTLIEVYGHHHPDYMAEAANAITSKPIKNARNGGRIGGSMKTRSAT